VVADINDEAGLKVVEDITNHGKKSGICAY
jgi:hypothetical protein